jgi:hypothetical protein
MAVFERFESQSISNVLWPDFASSWAAFKEIEVFPTPPLPPVIEILVQGLKSSRDKLREFNF